MPNFDGTGPQGQGPLTGRGQGKCKDNKSADVNSIRSGRGVGRGVGRGTGRTKSFGNRPNN